MNGVTIYWGVHLEHFTHIKIELDPTYDSIENSILDHLIEEFWMQNQYFLILIDGVPYEWEVLSVK
tara:strand:- start:555 stop:752 length:198 start_codon:yes stop_codon:yes gene_type:complete